MVERSCAEHTYLIIRWRFLALLLAFARQHSTVSFRLLLLLLPWRRCRLSDGRRRSQQEAASAAYAKRTLKFYRLPSFRWQLLSLLLRRRDKKKFPTLYHLSDGYCSKASPKEMRRSEVTEGRSSIGSEDGLFFLFSQGEEKEEDSQLIFYKKQIKTKGACYYVTRFKSKVHIRIHYIAIFNYFIQFCQLLATSVRFYASGFFAPQKAALKFGTLTTLQDFFPFDT